MWPLVQCRQKVQGTHRGVSVTGSSLTISAALDLSCSGPSSLKPSFPTTAACAGASPGSLWPVTCPQLLLLTSSLL